MKDNKQYLRVIGTSEVENLNFAAIAGHKKVTSAHTKMGLIITADSLDEFIKLVEDIQAAGFHAKEVDITIENFYHVSYDVNLPEGTKIKNQWRMPADQEKVSI